MLLLVASATFADSRADIPAADQQQKTKKLIDDAYGLPSAKTLAKKQEAIKKLVEALRDSGLPVEERYVVLTTIIRLAIDTGDAANGLQAISSLTEGFVVDEASEKAQFIVQYLEAAKTATQSKPVLDEAMVLAKAMASEDQFDVPRQLMASLDKAAKRLKDRNLVASVADLQKAIEQRQEAFAQQKIAQEALAADPDDPKANFVVGRWLAIHQDAWNEGLPHLAKGSDTQWKSASAAELAPPKETDEQLAVADAWRAISQTSSGLTKSAVQHHAITWYETVLATAKSPLVKDRVSQRLKEFGVSGKPDANAVTKPNRPKPTVAKNENDIKLGEPVDLLSFVDVSQHVLRGNWQRQSEGLTCEASPDARLLVPVAVRGNFELTCEFTRRRNVEAVQFTLPVGSRSCVLIMSGWSGAASGLNLVNGRECKDLPVSTGAAIRSGTLINDHRYKLVVKVNAEGRLAAIAATLDGQAFVDWKGELEQLSVPWHQAIPCPQAIGVTANDAVVDIHKLQLRVLKGGKGYRLGDDWQNPLAVVGERPASESIAQCLKWDNRYYFISEKPMDLPSAQYLAAALKGRLLTISSKAEEDFILKEGQGRSLWMAGWRRTNENQWRDERNRPLTFIGRWKPGEPSNWLHGPETQLVIMTTISEARGWHDFHGDARPAYACIEWGEEYP